jgi:hypothetical protein
MAGDVRVFAPMQTVAEVEGVSLLLLTVEVLDDLTAVRFCCPRSMRTRTLDAEHKRQLQEYIEGRRRGETMAPPPDAPVHTLFAGERFPSVTLDDGCGTEFSFLSGQTGSPGEWLIDVIFRGTPAPEARRLTVSITLPGGTTSAAQIVLQD